MSFSAIIPVAAMAAANEFLANAGQTPDPTRGQWGPSNFSVPAYAGSSATHATMHSWDIPGFRDDVAKISGVVIKDSVVAEEPAKTPAETVTTATAEVGAGWSQSAKPLTGIVTPGLHIKDGVLWWVIQSYNANVYQDPTVIPALVRRARVPGEAAPWVQPLDQYDAYKLVNAFTGKPDTCTYQGKTWKVTQADGSGNNVWAPGVYGWSEVK